MEHWFTLYLITRLDTIGWVAILLAVLFAAVAVFVLAFGYEANNFDRAKTNARKLLIAAACSLFVAVFTPSQKDALFIGSGRCRCDRSHKVRNRAARGEQIREAVERLIDSVMPEEKK